MKETKNTIKVISRTQKISSDSTSYKANQKSNIKPKKIDIRQFLNEARTHTTHTYSHKYKIWSVEQAQKLMAY